MTDHIARARYEAARPEGKLGAMTLWDPDLARLCKRVLRRPESLKPMRARDAVRVLEVLAASGSGRLVHAARQALIHDQRRSVIALAETLNSAVVRGDFTEEVTERTERLLSSEDLENAIAMLHAHVELDSDVLYKWAVENPDDAGLIARLRYAPNSLILLAGLRGEAQVDVKKYVAALPAERRGSCVEEVAATYVGPLTAQIVEMSVLTTTDLSAWRGITEVSDETLAGCLQGSIGNINAHAVLRLISTGALDPWRVLGGDLTRSQRAALAIAAGSVGDWEAVNTVLARGAVYTKTSGFTAGDLSNLLTMKGSERLSRRSVRECLRFCSAGQMLAYGRDPANFELIEAFLTEEQERYCDDAALARQELRDRDVRETALMRRLVRGRVGAVALNDSSPSVAKVVYEELESRIGDDPDRWKVALSLGKNWAGTLEELADAVLSITAKRR
jgi:hypothetical protein